MTWLWISLAITGGWFACGLLGYALARIGDATHGNPHEKDYRGDLVVIALGPFALVVCLLFILDDVLTYLVAWWRRRC